MSANSYTLIDVVRTVGFRAGDLKRHIETLENPDPMLFNLIQAVNDTLVTIARFKGLPAMNSETTVTTVADYETGTVAVTNGDETVTGTSTAWDSTMVGRAFSTSPKSPVYRVASVASTTSLELDREWSDDTASGEAYKIAQDRYELPSDFADFISASLTGARVRTLQIATPSEIDFQRHTMRGTPLDVGAPTHITVFAKSSGDKRMLEVDPFPDDEYPIWIRYKAVPTKLTSDNDVIPVFDKNIDILLDGALARWQSFSGGAEERQMWEAWKNQQMPELLSFDREKTDEVMQVVPDNVSREQKRSVTAFNI